MTSPTTIDYLSIGKRIRDRRNEMAMTQGQLSKKAAVTGSFIGHIERGEKVASLETMASISRALEVPLDWLVFGIHPKCEREACPLFSEMEGMLRAYGIGRA